MMIDLQKVCDFY